MDQFQLTYNIIFLFIALVGVFIVLNQEILQSYSNKSALFLCFIFLLILGFFFGGRSEEIGTDTWVYIYRYENFQYEGLGDKDIFYPLVLVFFRFFSKAPQFFLYCMGITYVSLIFLFIKNYKIDQGTVNKFLLFLLFFVMPSFLSMGINIIRQGIALVLLLNAYNALNEKRYKTMVLYCVFAMFFHLTSLIPIILYALTKYIRNIKISVGIFIVTILLALLNFGLPQILSAFLPFLSETDVRIAGYFSGDNQTLFTVGFKPQFVAFNSAFLVLALFINNSYEGNKEKYMRLLHYFCLSSSVFFMAFQIPYSDRWGIFSWVVAPLLLSPFILTGIQQRNMGSLFVYFFSVFIFLFFNVIYS
jgi:hypothetical protein